MKTYMLEFYGTKYEVFPKVASYSNNGTLAVQLMTVDYEPFATITVNLSDDGRADSTHQFVDINNCSFAPEFIEANGLGKFTGEYGFSGYCMYPLFEFDLDALKGGEII